MIPQQRILTILESVYDGAKEGTSDAWQRAYFQLSDLFSSGPGGLSLYSSGNDAFTRITTTFGEDCLRAFDTHYQHISPIQKQVMETPAGKTFWRVRDCGDKDFVKTEYYQDFARKEGVYDIANVKLCRRQDLDAMISFTRPKTNPFTEDDLTALDLLVPHLQSAFQIYLTLSDVKANNFYFKEVVGKSPRGVMFLNREAKVVYCNEAAEKMLIERDGLELDRNRCLVARHTHDARELRKTLSRVFETNTMSSSGGYLKISRPSGKRSLQVHISPLPEQNFAGYSPEKVALAFIFDPEQRFETVETLLQQMYGLTPAEARLAGLLAKGISLNEAAEMLNVRSSTIRTHMKHIFSKTDTKRQGELVTLIFNGLAALKNIK